jgi:hypothetical protein
MGHMDLFEATLCRFLNVEHDTDLAQLPMAALVEALGSGHVLRPLHALLAAQHLPASLAALHKVTNEQLVEAGLDTCQVRASRCTALALQVIALPYVHADYYVAIGVCVHVRTWTRLKQSGMQVTHLRTALDWELLCTLLDEFECGLLARRLAEKYSKEAAMPQAPRSRSGEAPPLRIRSMRDVHLFSRELVKELCGVDAAAAEHARAALANLKAMSLEERQALVAREFFSYGEQVGRSSPRPESARACSRTGNAPPA